ncbi:MAG: signal recognition particle protein [Oligoflexia bacterium]|nr:signal recognition particle protein [Oligoflexia bacterium]
MFENLVNGFNSVFSKIKGTARIREKELENVLEDLKLSLLDADVHYDVVDSFLDIVREKAAGAEIHKALSPVQQILKIVSQALTELLGSKSSSLRLSGSPAVIMLVGLQGAGKTTTAVKLAKYLKDQDKKEPLLVGVDFNRPAALEQLRMLGQGNGINVYTPEVKKASKALKEALKYASINRNDVIIIDTAGRLHIDRELMNELGDLKSAFKPSEILLVADSMLGRSAVDVAKEFDSLLDLSGYILTKMDSDTRGGAVLSLFNTTKKPIKFMGFGEKATELEVFHPERVVSRILDLGDMMTLIEKAEKTFDKEEAAKLEKKLRKNTFDIEDFLNQIKQIKKMGSMESLLGLIPGFSGLKGKLGSLTPPDEELKKIEAIICSMTRRERQLPDIINGSRRKRIAAGSGTSINDVNRFVKQFNDMKKLMKHLPKSGFPDLGMLRNLNLK